ncbi:MAG TPA: MgtC/SapB family protein [Pirellulaceae bacterium]|nr:MgtC/SapB family protein [Pirellulaceae bacterium]
MDEDTRSIFQQLGISLALGLLVGLQRQHRRSLIAGLRTFPLITVLGTLAATFDRTLPSGGWMTPSGFIGLTVVVAISMVYELRREDADVGITTEAAILLMYLVGAYVVLGDRIVAIAVGAGVAVLLQFKPELHGFAARLGDEDLRAIMTFALITCIILPVLPNTTYQLVPPLNVLNPFEIWTMVVLMVGISLGGYLTYKFLGRTAGVLLGGLLGGAISSTATTVTYARRSGESEDSSRLATVVVVIASAVVYLRVIVEIAAVAPRWWTVLVPPIALMMGASAVTAGVAWLRIRHATEQMPEQRNPTELKSALVFAALYAGVLLALTASKTYLGGQGLYGVAVLSGLTDMDAITLSVSRLVGLDPQRGGIAPAQAWRLIVLATMANLVFKWTMCLLIGKRRFAWEVGALFAVPLIAGGLLLWLWP